MLTRRNKHSSFSSTFPIYLFTQRTEEVPDEEAVTPAEDLLEDLAEESTSPAPESTEVKESEEDEDEAIVEEISEDEEKTPEEKEIKMKSVVVDEWMHLNPMPPLWLR